MIPILYWSTEKTFTSNGVGRLTDALSCYVEEERNGIFELELEYPATGPLEPYLKKGMIISATHDDTKTRQPFVIYRRSAVIDGKITVNACHITYGASNVIVGPFGTGSISGVISGIASHLLTGNEFTLASNITKAGYYNLSHPASLRSMLAGEEGSLLDVYGGELQYDNFTINLLQRRGEDTDVTIRYGKNLIDLEHELDYNDRYNAILPYWVNSSTGQSVYGSVVYASGIPTEVGILHTEDGTPLSTEDGANVFEIYSTPTKVRAYDFTEYFETQPTQLQLEAQAAAFLAANRPWLPIDNLVVDFVQLAQTDEYAAYAPLQRVNLCDTVSVYHPELGIAMTGIKVIRTRYDTLREIYDEIELGDPTVSFADTIEASIGNTVVTKINEVLDMEGVFNRLTNYGESEGIYVEDGKLYINASYIASGIINADLIKAGTLKGVEFISESTSKTYTGVHGDYTIGFRFSAEGMQIILTPVGDISADLYDASSPIIEALMSSYVSADTGNDIDYPIMSIPEAKLGNVWYMDVDSGVDSYTTIGQIIHDLYKETFFKTVTKSYTVSPASGGSSNITANNFGISTPSGYTPIAMAAVQSSNSHVVIRYFNAMAVGSNTMVAVRNVSTAAASSTITVTVLYAKTERVGT